MMVLVMGDAMLSLSSLSAGGVGGEGGRKEGGAATAWRSRKVSLRPRTSRKAEGNLAFWPLDPRSDGGGRESK